MLLSVKEFLKEARDDFRPDMFQNAMCQFMEKGPNSKDIDSIVSGELMLVLNMNDRTFGSNLFKGEVLDQLIESQDFYAVPAMDLLRHYMH